MSFPLNPSYWALHPPLPSRKAWGYCFCLSVVAILMVVSSQRQYSELPTRCTPNTSLFLDVSCLSSVIGLSRLSFSLFLKVTGNPEVNDVIIQFKLLNVDVISQAPPVIGCFAPLCSVQPQGGGAGSDGQSLPRLRWLPIWFAAS